MCGRGRKFNNVKAGVHPPIYYAGGRSFTFKWAPAMDTSSPLNARYASYGRYLCRDDKFNRRLETRLEIRETTRFLPHTCFFPPLSGKYTYSMIFFLTQRGPPLVSSPRSRFDHARPLLSSPLSLRNLYFSRNTYSIKYFPGYD